MLRGNIHDRAIQVVTATADSTRRESFSAQMPRQNYPQCKTNPARYLHILRSPDYSGELCLDHSD